MLTGFVNIICGRRARHQASWQFDRVSHQTVLIDGTTVTKNTYVMQRRINGRWQYRLPTQAEMDDATERFLANQW